ncbi:unnamed protein product [Paramecium primaurelia]|uniref:V-type proton ATPase subunit n=1 Tax=Paramecium primaurelia TaxID=5886 RepID=A0A8S1KSV3_PARPR|nr:unnamed protein product [Paramecium primaurelia]CAD8059812.1 unnamed protein product [Paramecium primaurelia]
MDLCVFGVDDGYAEAIIRGLRASFLTEAQYQQMKNCASIPELKSFLEETDYQNCLQADNPQIPTSILRQRLKKKLADEFEYIEAQSTGTLTKYLFHLRCRFMIDNVVNMIEGLKNKIDIEILLSNIDPLGWFPEIKNIKVLEGDDYSSLYRDVLIDTPIGVYFMKFLEESIENLHENRTLNDIQNLFREMKPEYIRTSLKKMWLEDFYLFCEQELMPTSQEVLLELLKFEADFKTIQVIYNSIGNRDLNTAAKIITTRKQLCPTIGNLYPDCEKMYLQAMTLDTLREAVKGCDNYRDLLKDAPDPLKREEFNVQTKTLDDIMYDDECRRYALAFDGQGSYGVFYSYLKLKEQEIRNIIWLAEMISRKLAKNHPGWKKIIIPFSHLGK